jgi:ferritin heavy chain
MDPKQAQVRQNFHAETEKALNKQINVELHASYVYLSLACYFDRDDVALEGFHKYFCESSNEERDHAKKMMKYLNMRGGRLILEPIDKPEKDSWGTGLEAMQSALEIEKNVNQCLLDLHKLASSHEDANMCDWLESEFLHEQVEAIKKIGDFVTNLKRVGPGLGEYMFDRDTLQKSS